MFLTGLMGTGKTTVGKLLAARLQCPFVDLDERIERIFARTIPELFAAGEPEFRALESHALRTLLDEPAFAAREVVVATGGGLVLDPTHRDAMARVGTIVWLDTDVATLATRLAATSSTRPLLAGAALPERLATLLAERASAYRDRSLRIDAAAAPEVVVDRVLAALPGARR